MVGNLLKRVIKVRIEGAITQKLYDRVAQGLHKARFYSPEAVVFVVNSLGGSISQAKNIADLIKCYAQKKNVPIYCFAEDQCLGSANAILTCGVKTYANEMSLLGDFNYSWNSLWFKKFADKYHIKQEFIYSGQNKLKFNPFEDMKPESEKWMQNYLYLLEHELKCTVVNQREAHFTKKQLDKVKIQSQVFSGGLIQPSKAVELGLIDGIMNCDDLLNTTFKGVKVCEISKRNKLTNITEAMMALGLR